jgi:hypothetical protein
MAVEVILQRIGLNENTIVSSETDLRNSTLVHRGFAVVRYAFALKCLADESLRLVQNSGNDTHTTF